MNLDFYSWLIYSLYINKNDILFHDHKQIKIGDLLSICRTLHGFGFLYIANYEVLVGESKVFLGWNKQQPAISFDKLDYEQKPKSMYSPTNNSHIPYFLPAVFDVNYGCSFTLWK